MHTPGLPGVWSLQDKFVRRHMEAILPWAGCWFMAQNKPFWPLRQPSPKVKEKADPWHCALIYWCNSGSFNLERSINGYMGCLFFLWMCVTFGFAERYEVNSVASSWRKPCDWSKSHQLCLHNFITSMSISRFVSLSKPALPFSSLYYITLQWWSFISSLYCTMLHSSCSKLFHSSLETHNHLSVYTYWNSRYQIFPTPASWLTPNIQQHSTSPCNEVAQFPWQPHTPAYYSPFRTQKRIN